MTGKPFSEWSDSRKQTLKEYNQKNYSVIGCKLPREIADSFRKYCKDRNTTVSFMLSDFVKSCLASQTENESD